MWESLFPVEFNRKFKSISTAFVAFLRKYIVVRWVLAFAVVVISGLTFSELAGDVWLQEGLAWDKPIILFVHFWHTGWLDTFFLRVSETADQWVPIPLIIVCGWFVYTHHLLRILLTVLSCMLAFGLNIILKAIFQRPRPDLITPLIIEKTYSFPSGHTAMATGLYGLIALFFWEDGYQSLAILSGLWVVLVGISRIYLGAHYPSDVIASIAVTSILVNMLFMLSVKLGHSHKIAPQENSGVP